MNTSKYPQRPAHYADFKSFVKEFGDRNVPPYFAGRRSLLGEIEDACVASWERHAAGQRQQDSQTKVIYGAPGAGKTALLKHLRDSWECVRFTTAGSDGRTRLGEPPIMLYMQSAVFRDRQRVSMGLIELLAPGSEKKVGVSKSESKRIEGGLSVGLGGGGASRESTTNYAVGSGLQAVVDAVPLECWTRPVVLGIDETQNLPEQRASDPGLFLQEIHANDLNLPLIVVLGGLSDTVKRVRQLGLSRLQRECKHSLGRLMPDEVEELKHGFCKHFNIQLDGYESRLDDILAIAEGWPSHLANALLAFSKVYLECGCDMSKVDFDEASKISLKRRIGYYHDRNSDEMNGSAVLLSRIMDRVEGGQSKAQVVDLIEKISAKYRSGASFGERLPRGMNAEDYYEHLIHCGALQEDDEKMVSCPIPSFRQYLIGRGRISDDAVRGRHAPSSSIEQSAIH